MLRLFVIILVVSIAGNSAKAETVQQSLLKRSCKCDLSTLDVDPTGPDLRTIDQSISRVLKAREDPREMGHLLARAFATKAADALEHPTEHIGQSIGFSGVVVQIKKRPKSSYALIAPLVKGYLVNDWVVLVVVPDKLDAKVGEFLDIPGEVVGVALGYTDSQAIKRVPVKVFAPAVMGAGQLAKIWQAALDGARKG